MARQSRGTGRDREAQRVAAHCREYAAELRVLADGEPDAAFRDKLTAIAEEYEARADASEPRKSS
jgi:hypothetical protein